ncbi:MAG: FAD:protein FMN transferase [Clostridia bacterium]|nr:FAD:protein FMN transferase [Clostridia bacterium]
MKKLFLILLAMLCLVSCSSKNEYESHTFFSMDTFAEVRVYNGRKDATSSAERIANDIEKIISKTLSNSPIYTLNATDTSSTDLNDTLDEILNISLEIAEITDGAFEPMSGGLVELWEKCETEQRLPGDEELSEQISAIHNTEIYKSDGTLFKNGGAKFEFGAIGKGYAADKMVQILKDNGVSVGMVSFVSTVSVFGDRDFKIAVRTPDNSGETAGYLTMRDQSLSVSGDYERFYTINDKTYNHIINPYSGYPVSNGTHSVAVVCESAAVADALSTAIFVMDIEKAMELYSSGVIEFEMMIITDEHIIITPGMMKNFELVTTKYKLAEN